MLLLTLLLLDIQTPCTPKIMAIMTSRHWVCEGQLDFETYGIGKVVIEPGDFSADKLEHKMLSSFSQHELLGVGTQATLHLQITKTSQGSKHFGVTAHARGKWELLEGNKVLANGWWLCSTPEEFHKKKRLGWVWENLDQYFIEQFTKHENSQGISDEGAVVKASSEPDMGKQVADFELKSLKLGMSLNEVKKVRPISDPTTLDGKKEALAIFDNHVEKFHLKGLYETRHKLSEDEELVLWFHGPERQLIRIHYVRDFPGRLNTPEIMARVVENYGVSSSGIERIGGYPSEDLRAIWATSKTVNKRPMLAPQVIWEAPRLSATVVYKRKSGNILSGPGRVLGTQLTITLTSENLGELIEKAEQDYREKRGEEKKEMVESITF